MNDITQDHTVLAYNEELAQLRGVVLEMGELVTGQVSDAIKALCKGDMGRARQVLEHDRKVGELDIEVDGEIHRLIALRQPKASDLRLVLAFSKSVAELSRIGDRAREIAAFAERLDDDENRKPRKKLLRHIKLMNERACCMLERSLESLTTVDVPAAIEILKEDAELDDEFDAGMRHLVTFMWENPSAITRVLDMVFVLKALERVGDHAKHIAQQVVFVAEGRDVRHLNPELLESL